MRSTSVAVSRTGDRLAYVANDADGQPQIFVVDVDGTDLRQLTQEPFHAAEPTWSPDGSQIAHLGWERDGGWELYVIEVAEGVSRRLTTERHNVSNTLEWAADGGSILYQTSRVGGGHQFAIVRRVETATLVTSSIVKDAALPDLSPDRAQIAFNTWSQAVVTLANIDGSARRVISGEAYGAKWSPSGASIAWQKIVAGCEFCPIEVYDVATGEASLVGSGEIVDWIDDRTLLVSVGA